MTYTSYHIAIWIGIGIGIGKILALYLVLKVLEKSGIGPPLILIIHIIMVYQLLQVFN